MSGNLKLQTSNLKPYYAVIMAGGVGSRFWPLSTEDHPKQFHDLLGTGESLIQSTYRRLCEVVPAENILVSTNKKYKEQVLQHLTAVSENQLILEPALHNTAPSILYAALKINALNPNAVLLLAPSDHWIDDEKEFVNNVHTAFEFCKNEDVIMTLGIEPTFPHTEYGYIKFDATELQQNEDLVTSASAFKEHAEEKTKPTTKPITVQKFTEKPTIETAKKFIASGNYLWNAGLYVFNNNLLITGSFNNITSGIFKDYVTCNNCIFFSIFRKFFI